ncbi:MAG: 5'-nucleotidase C-terminal domain-containing protein [Spirochaetales bacterium]|nr:5'-nucleotidase C-terminal domain-containing protein [Spirochaetales bacterium]
MKRFALALAVVAALFAAACVSTPKAPASAELVVLHFNDYHGQLAADANGQGGIAAMAGYVASVRKANKNVLLLNAGDINTGSMVSDKNNALPDIEIFNQMSVDVMTVGNHEFDKAPEVMAAQIAASDFPWISANIRKGGAPAFLHYVVKTVGGLKVGIFGLTTSDTPVKAHPLKVAEYDFTDEIEAARETVRILRELEQVNVVIGLFHTGLGEGSGPTPSDKIAAAVPGIDLIVDGHSHTDMAEPVMSGGTPIVMAAYNARKVGKAVIAFADGKASLKSWEAVPMNLKDKDGKLIGAAVTPDAGTEALVKKYADEIKAAYAVQVATTSAAFDIGDRLVRKQETPLGNLVADSMIWKVRAMGIKADFAVTNGGGIRKSIPAGVVTRMNAYEVLPFGNTLAYFEMTGAKVMELFANVGKISPGNGGWANMSSDVRYTVDLSDKAVKDLTIGGKPVDMNKTYIVVTNDFLAVGGDGVYPVFGALKFKDTFLDMLEGFIEYMKQLPQPLTPATDGRAKLVP